MSEVNYARRDNRSAPDATDDSSWMKFGVAMILSWVFGIPIAIANLVYKLYQKKIAAKNDSKSIGAPKFSFPPIKKAVTPKPLAEREFDLIVYGATGYTGKLACRYLSRQYGMNGKIKWAIAGRRKDALEKVRDLCVKENPDMGSLPIFQVDLADEEKLQEMTAQARSISTFAGPYQNYGTPIVRACIATGTNCCDITGEIAWHQGLIDCYHGEAKASGSKIVSFCGHDCVPWDLMTYKLAQKLKEVSPGEEMVSVFHEDEIQSAPSGGTLETVLESIFEGGNSYTAQNIKGNPMSTTLDGKLSDYRIRQGVDNLIPIKTPSDKWGGFFIMSDVNGKVVGRANAVHEYGKNLKYSETRVGPDLKTVIARYFALFALAPIIAFPDFLRNKILPAPGQGSSDEVLKKGFLQLEATGTGEKGTKVAARMYFPTDPGYPDTARMCVEAALTAALSPEKCESGVLTPAVCFPDAFFERLLNSGTEFTYLSTN